MNDELIIEGNKILRGHIKIQGSKNLSVSVIPASLLAKDIVTLNNVPPIGDVFLLIKILNYIGVKTHYKDETLIIDSRHIRYRDLTISPIGKFRASYYFMGVMIGMFHHLKIIEPGGCRFGVRPIDYHLQAFADCGVLYEEGEVYSFSLNEAKNAHILFNKSSVGASINVALLAVQLDTITKIENIALEPEVTELLLFLKKMGADIEGIGTPIITIKGGKNLHGTTYDIIPDRIEAGTYALIGASLGDPLIIEPVYKEHLEALFHIFDLLHINYAFKNHKLIIKKGYSCHGILVETSPYPGFPTDLQQPLTAFLSNIQATSIIIENIYQHRFAHIGELHKMGADIQQINQMIIIHGQQSLKGSCVNAKDLRGGAALVIASLLADGTSVVKGLNYINRGYEQLVKKLQSVGASIKERKSNEKN